MKCTNYSSLSAIFRSKITELELGGKINSCYRYRSTLSAIEKFAGEGLRIDEVTPALLRAMEEAWRASKKGDTTINIYMSTLKAVIASTAVAGTENFPFGKGKYTPPMVRERKLALSRKQLAKIFGYQGRADLEEYRDLWVFSYLCNGINFKDMLLLKRADGHGGEIHFIRSKTMREGCRRRIIKAVIVPKMSEIMERRGAPKGRLLFRYAEGCVSPKEIAEVVKRTVRACNLAMAELSGILGVPKFTTYSARHSYATMLLRAGVNIGYISESLGHSSISITQAYLAGFEETQRVKYSKVLTDFR